MTEVIYSTLRAEKPHAVKKASTAVREPDERLSPVLSLPALSVVEGSKRRLSAPTALVPSVEACYPKQHYITNVALDIRLLARDPSLTMAAPFATMPGE